MKDMPKLFKELQVQKCCVRVFISLILCTPEVKMYVYIFYVLIL